MLVRLLTLLLLHLTLIDFILYSIEAFLKEMVHLLFANLIARFVSVIAGHGVRSRLF